MANQDDIAAKLIVSLYDRVNYSNSKDALVLQPNEVAQLRSSWGAWVHGDLSQAGFKMFTHMFEIAPQTKEVFPFAQGQVKSAMQSSGKVLFHVARVARYIDNVVRNADFLQNVVGELRQAGGRHGRTGYNVKTSFFPFLAKSHMELMAREFPGWNPALASLWTRIWNFIGAQMGYGQEILGGGQPQ